MTEMNDVVSALRSETRYNVQAIMRIADILDEVRSERLAEKLASIATHTEKLADAVYKTWGEHLSGSVRDAQNNSFGILKAAIAGLEIGSGRDPKIALSEMGLYTEDAKDA
jgi:hypothetical protein